MYVQKQSWLENGPARRRKVSGLGDTVNLNAYGFVDPSIDQSGDCTFGADPSNPQCLSAAGQAAAAAAAAGQKGSPSTAGAGLNMNYVIYGGVALVLALAVARR